MFARNVAISLKPNALTEFTQKLENEVVPVLRKQHGFRDEIILLSQDNIHVHAISLWDSREAAEAYDKAAYPQVLKSLETLVAGSPKVRVSTVLQSTVYMVAPVASAA
jgi:heme-degrading monooxygenase HmoA